MKFDLLGKNALVTGATGGIGEAIALTLDSHGANIIATGTRPDALEKLSSKLKNKHLCLKCDLSDIDSTNKLVENIEETFGPVEILVCNAGITKDNLSMRMTNEDFEKVIEVNLLANFILNREAIKKMMRRRSGRIINISSVVGATGNAGQVNYAASKAGLVGLTKSLALEVAQRNITINAIAPGFIRSPMTDKLNENQKEEIMKKIPSGRFGDPEEIANLVLYLASDYASYITGQTIHINGGMYFAS